MRILYHFRTRGTGAEAVHIAGIANAMEALGHTVEFSSPTGIDPRKSAGQSPYQDQGKPGLVARMSRKCPGFVFELLEIGYNVAAYIRNRRLLRRDGIDLIYERHAFFLCSSAFLGCPLVLEVNELVGDKRVRAQPVFSFLARWADRMIFRKAALIVVVSPHLKRRIEALGVPGEKVLVLPNAVNGKDFEQLADGSAVSARFGLEGKTVIGFIGWFVEWHRLERLVEVFAQLAGGREDLVLMLVGEGQLRQSLQELARSCGVENQVIFAGSAPHSEIPTFIAAMDICVVPHSNEYRSPIKLFEYMGQGKAVVAPRMEPIEMILKDGENGVLFESESSEDLGRKLSGLIEDAELRARIGERARADVLAKHTWINNAQRVLEAVL